MEENKVVNLNEEQTAAEEKTAEEKAVHQKALMKQGVKMGVGMALKAAGKVLGYMAIGGLTVFGVFAILGKASSALDENGDDAETCDGSCEANEAAGPQMDGSSEE